MNNVKSDEICSQSSTKLGLDEIASLHMKTICSLVWIKNISTFFTILFLSSKKNWHSKNDDFFIFSSQTLIRIFDSMKMSRKIFLIEVLITTFGPDQEVVPQSLINITRLICIWCHGVSGSQQYQTKKLTWTVPFSTAYRFRFKDPWLYL